jgi:hypothetical protein
MKNIFLSFSFSQGYELTRAVERLLASHDIGIITGRQLGGEQVDSAVENKILQADALISLLTKKTRVKRGELPTSQPVLQEYYFARNQRMRAIAVIEDGLKFNDMSNRECIPYKLGNPLEAILRISETIAEWRRESGEELKVQILPSTLADKLATNERLTCSHRFLEKDISTPWKDVPAIPEEEGTFVYLRGVRIGHRIQLRVVEQPQNVTWQSPAKSPWAMLQLKETQNG